MGAPQRPTGMKSNLINNKFNFLKLAPKPAAIGAAQRPMGAPQRPTGMMSNLINNKLINFF
jgi:hypothetical protein